jgi:hypothetical protein
MNESIATEEHMRTIFVGLRTTTLNQHYKFTHPEHHLGIK